MKNILFCGNIKVFDGMLTCMLSIFMRTKSEEPYHFYIFTMDVSHLREDYVPVSDEQIRFLQEIAESYNKENNPDKTPREKLPSAICGAIMLTAVIAFLLMGFLGELWHIGWVVFPVGGILCGIISMFFSTKEK